MKRDLTSLPSTFSFVRNASLGPPQHVDAYTTFNINLAETNPNGGSYAGLIRARRGTSPERLAAAVDAVGRIVDARDFKSRGLKLYPVGLKADLVSGVRPALLVLRFAGVFLVLVLMVNLGSVLLARAARREHEYAVSRALGANGAAVARATLSGGAILGLIGGVAATVAATWGARTLIALAPLDLPRRESVALDFRIGVVIIGLGILLGLVAAIPALWASRVTLSSLRPTSTDHRSGAVAAPEVAIAGSQSPFGVSGVELSTTSDRCGLLQEFSSLASRFPS
jgi:FtsX-like permease family